MSGLGNPYGNIPAVSTGIQPTAPTNSPLAQTAQTQALAKYIQLMQAMKQQQGQQPPNMMNPGQGANMNAPYGGVANAGNQVLSAYMSPNGPGGQNAAANNAYQNAYASAGYALPTNTNPSMMQQIGNLFGLGGS